MRTQETIRAELTQTRERLELYLEKEKELLSKSGVQSYTIGSRSLSHYQTALADIRDMIDYLKKKIDELEAELSGSHARRAIAIVPRDW